jgi:hypothetical protein
MTVLEDGSRVEADEADRAMNRQHDDVDDSDQDEQDQDITNNNNQSPCPFTADQLETCSQLLRQLVDDRQLRRFAEVRTVVDLCKQVAGIRINPTMTAKEKRRESMCIYYMKFLIFKEINE